MLLLNRTAQYKGFACPYGISSGSNSVWLGASSEEFTYEHYMIDTEFKVNLNYNDIIILEYHVSSSQLIFKCKKEQIYLINLPTDKIWYPAVSVLSGDSCVFSNDYKGVLDGME